MDMNIEQSNKLIKKKNKLYIYLKKKKYTYIKNKH